MSDRTRDSVVRAFEYLEANLRNEINLADLSDAAGYSLYHFIRVFNTVTRHNPFDYLMRRRLSECALLLRRDPEVRIIDVAVEYGFGSHEAFTRAFRRMFGMTPSAYRTAPRIDCLIGSTGPPFFAPMDPAYLEFLDSTTILPDREECRQLKLFGVMEPAGYPPLPPSSFDGDNVLHRPVHHRVRRFADEIRLFDGYVVESVDSPSVDGCYMVLPEGEYLCFTVEGPAENLPHLYRYVLLTWMPLDGRSGHIEFAVERYHPEKFSLLIPSFGPKDCRAG